MSRRLATVAASIAALALAGFIVADAAQLGVNSNDTHTNADQRCTDGPVATTGGTVSSGNTYTTVSLADLSSACTGESVQLVVYGAGGTQLATGSGTAGTAPFDVTTTSYDSTQVVGVALLVGTWGVPTTWTAPTGIPAISCVPLNPGGNPWKNHTCSVSITGNSGTYPNSNPPGGLFYNFTFNVTTDGVSWRVTINFADPAFPFSPVFVGQYANQVKKAPGYTCGTPVTTLVIEPDQATWGATLYIGQNGAPNWGWGGQTLCP